MDPTDLADMDFEALATHVVAMAQRARKLSVEGDVVELRELLDQVRRAASTAAGERLALLEVAEAFLRAMARSDLGRSEIALRRLFAEHPEIAEVHFTRLLKPDAAMREDELLDEAGEARARIRELIDLGVLRRTGKLLDVRPSLRPLAREMLEPAVFRMWHRVNRARAEIQRAEMKPPAASAYLAAQLGITPAQASVHLETHTIRQPLRLVDRFAGQQRVPVTSDTVRTTVLYQRDKPADPRLSTTPTVTHSGQGVSPMSSLFSGASQQGQRLIGGVS
jgi:hypothetical protein